MTDRNAERTSGGGWLREPWEVAVNEVLSACIEAADHYDTAARRFGRSAIAQMLDDLARQRRMMACRMEVRIRAHGALPAEPDPDAELVHRVAEWLRAAVATDEARAALETRLADEARLASMVEEAEATGPPPDVARCLAEISRDLGEHRARLAAALRS
jgi:hypothetical protein